MAYEFIRAEREEGAIAVVQLYREAAYNAFNQQLMDELTDAMDGLDGDPEVRCIVLTGVGRAFAAGADIKEMQNKSFPGTYAEDFITANWERTARMRTPVIAAVNGLALGGGCELAMMCDFILASDRAEFGQPEINLGVSPGAGGTQRLARFIGKSKTMEMCLTGRNMKADEAERCGLVARVVPHDELMDDAREVARKIAEKSAVTARMTKEMVNAAYETTLSQGILFERRLFHALFATEDQKEGMEAYVEKRLPHFLHK
ncbi:MAG: enoyl-CoA hydratase-related protein [Pseudomonadota bacterium]